MGKCRQRESRFFGLAAGEIKEGTMFVGLYL
jgi:hypothetical protein